MSDTIINTLMLDIMLFSRFNGCELLLLLPQFNSLKKVLQLGTVSSSVETLLFSEFLTYTLYIGTKTLRWAKPYCFLSFYLLIGVHTHTHTHSLALAPEY